MLGKYRLFVNNYCQKVTTKMTNVENNRIIITIQHYNSIVD
ncbi:MAG: hypothetical protein ACI97K_002061 [Glaciecola sp.]|jgi:hypothetical protein